jgi:transcriptional regulator with XRE-family HTH domain
MYAIMDKNSLDFSDWLFKQMGAHKWSQSDLARASGLNRQSISDYVNRRRTNPEPEALIAISRAFGLPPEDVFRAAGLLPPKPEANEITRRAEHILENYKYPETKARALEYLEFLRLQEEQGTYDVIPASKKARKSQESLSKALGA